MYSEHIVVFFHLFGNEYTASPWLKVKGDISPGSALRSLRQAYPAIVLAVWRVSQGVLWPGMLQAILLNVSAHC